MKTGEIVEVLREVDPEGTRYVHIEDHATMRNMSVSGVRRAPEGYGNVVLIMAGGAGATVRSQVAPSAVDVQAAEALLSRGYRTAPKYAAECLVTLCSSIEGQEDPEVRAQLRRDALRLSCCLSLRLSRDSYYEDR